MDIIVNIAFGLVIWTLVSFAFGLWLGPKLAENAKHYPEVKK